MAKELRHKPGTDAFGFTEVDELAQQIGVPAYKVLSTALFNWDSQKRTWRFGLSFGGASSCRGQVWDLLSEDPPRTKGVDIYVCAKAKHTNISG
jgi:hypothetical protein